MEQRPGDGLLRSFAVSDTIFGTIRIGFGEAF